VTRVAPIPLARIADSLRLGDISPADFVSGLWDRIERLEPEVQAMLPEPGRRERLRREAADLETRCPTTESCPPLFGVPVGVKDIYRVDGFPTGCGSTLPPELFEGPEAPVVTALKAAGALILGKTVTTEFAYFEPGLTRNPHNAAHTPGGSSSGSAAAVAAGYCPLALGSQTVGSVIRPAAFCGVAGFKTTYGRVSLDGVVPYSPSLDHFGFFVARAEDLLLPLTVLLQEEVRPPPRPPVLAVPTGPYLRQASPEMLAAFEAWMTRLETAGLVVLPIEALGDIEAINRRHQRLAAAEMAEVHREWFPRWEERYRPRTAALIREGRTVSPEEVAAGQEGRQTLREELHKLMERHGIDVWISPAATGPAPEGLGSTGDPAMNLPWTHAGLPVASIPAGFADNGLPLGLQCAGRSGEDLALASFAIEIERRLSSR